MISFVNASTRPTFTTKYWHPSKLLPLARY